MGDAKPGWIAALHTWGRTLIAHPHLHVLITGGGLLPDGTWRAVRNGYFLPFRQVRHVFRQRFCDALEAKLRAGELDLPEDLSLEKALRIVAKARRRKWNVRVEAPYRHGDGVATYLARYLKGGPIKNHRLVSFDGESVRFRYGDFREADASGKPKWKVLELSVEEFLRRLILHIPLPGMKMVRSYGLYAHTCRDQLEQARGQIEPSEEWLAARERFERAAEKRRADQPRCPICGLSAGRGHRQRGALRRATTGRRGGPGRMRDLDSFAAEAGRGRAASGRPGKGLVFASSAQEPADPRLTTPPDRLPAHLLAPPQPLTSFHDLVQSPQLKQQRR